MREVRVARHHRQIKMLARLKRMIEAVKLARESVADRRVESAAEMLAEALAAAVEPNGDREESS